MMVQVELSSWQPYRPSTASPWDLRRVHHLHRRAGFGANWGELQRDLDSGPHAAIDRLLLGNDVAEDFDSLQHLIGDAAVSSSDIHRLKAWWFYRMLYSGDPLTERMTLMWHNHFATSNLKVSNVAFMKVQNDKLRKNAMGKFSDLLRAVVKDAAMMVWLDARANRKDKPNENLARELMELFTLGVGHYQESDVQEVARALTGWTIRDDAFVNVEAYHDTGPKRILGRQGSFDGDDVLAILLDQDAVAERIASRLCDVFFGENVVPAGQLNELAVGLREHDLDLRWAVETILRSEAFFAENNIGNRILDPIQFMVGTLRSLERVHPPPSTFLLAEWSARLGQDLFCPPSVFGWPGERAWLSTRTMIGRANYATALLQGELHRPSQPIAIEELAQKYGCSTAECQTRFASELLFGNDHQTGDVGWMLRSTSANLG
ncbi:DUF1800 domain-containing protein [Aureliella helgolandensis]|uniref:DUF1800 domain-containing protein n=1 Tax=Aureliella helgolandensis TaxID=2527968 RepID=A0A518G1Y5_9BACT|nr:DUF1800 domain-containing protein [Aureliella helgolandensis]QDV22570.1 hypothetical protein Q31a_08560 [Aureliella helgolandensis]